jgi:hypothetical protein
MECSFAKMSGLFCILKIQGGCHHRAKFEQGISWENEKKLS